jgi:hypothetical protein
VNFCGAAMGVAIGVESTHKRTERAPHHVLSHLCLPPLSLLVVLVRCLDAVDIVKQLLDSILTLRPR